MQINKYILPILIIIFSYDFIYPIGNINSSRHKKVIAEEGEKIAVSPNKLGPGIWKIKRYNPSSLELLEDIKKPFPSFIFRTLKASQSLLELEYTEKNITKQNIYKITIQKRKEKTNKVFYKKEKQSIANYITKEKISTNPKEYYKYIKKLYNLKLYEESIKSTEEFEILFNNSNKIKEIKLIKADALIKIGDYSKAEILYQNIIEKNTDIENKVKILFLLTKVYKGNKSHKKLKNTLTNIIALSKNPFYLSKAYFKLGNIYLLSREYEIAIKQFGTIIEQFPEERNIREKTLYLLSSAHYKKNEMQNYYKSYKYLRILKEEFPYGKYYKKSINKIKYLKENFINFF